MTLLEWTQPEDVVFDIILLPFTSPLGGFVLLIFVETVRLALNELAQYKTFYV